MVTTNISTVGTASDYDTLELWETGEAKDCVAGDVIEKVEMVDEVHTAGLNLNSGSWVTDVTRYIWIDADPAGRHDGTAGTGARIIEGAGSHILQTSVSVDVHYTWLELGTSAPGPGMSGILLFDGSAKIHADKVIIHGFTDINGRGVWYANIGGEVTLTNCILYDIERAGAELDTGTNNCVFNSYHCTYYKVGTEVLGAPSVNDAPIVLDNIIAPGSKDVDLRNNLLHSEESFSIGSAPDQDNSEMWNLDSTRNILSDGQGTAEEMPGDFVEDVTFQAGTGGSGIRVMFTNVTGGSEDLHLLRDDDNAAIQYGENLTALAATLPTNIFLDRGIDDLVRSTFVGWDAGAHNLRAIGSDKTVSASRRRMMTVQSTIVGATDVIEITGLPADFPHNFLSAQFYDSSGDQIVPTGGTILLEIETVSGSPNFEEMVDGVVDATNPATLTWAANTHSLRATPTGLEDGGVNSWRIVATFNRT